MFYWEDWNLLRNLKQKNKIDPDTSKYIKIESLKISIRDLNKDDISKA